jgi:hypothetical protein
MYVFTMEKSREERAEQHKSAFEMVDTRPVNGKSVNRLTRANDPMTELKAAESPQTLRAWISTVAYWIREMLWRRRFWSKLDQGIDHGEESGS